MSDKSLNNMSNYGHSFQIKLLNLLLSDKKFLNKVISSLTSGYFESQAIKWIIDNLIEYYSKYHTYPTMDILSIEVKKVSNDVLKVAVIEVLREVYNLPILEDGDKIKDEFTVFCTNQNVKNALLKSVDLLESGNFQDIRRLLDKALRTNQDDNIGHVYQKDVETRHRQSERKTIPTPWPEINKILQGGLGGGDLGLVFGGPGTGKSWTVIDIGTFAIKNGYNVLHYTLELGESYIGLRYDARLVEKNVSEITKYRKNIEKELNDNPEYGKLIIKEFPTGRVTLQAIESHIRQIKSEGIEPHLIIIDYIDLLKNSRNRTDKKDDLDDIYIETRGLAKELNLPIWTPSQINRSGSKDAIVESDKIAGSFDKIMIADFSMALSRMRRDKLNGTGRFHIQKNRYGSDGNTYNCTIDTSCGKIIFLNEMNDMEIKQLEKEEKKAQDGQWGKIDDDEKSFLRKKFNNLD